MELRAHVQNKGWVAWRAGSAGTTGQGLRMEAVALRLTGEAAKSYDISYRVHVQNLGWTGWARNGETAGTTSRALRIEAVEAQLAPKGKGRSSAGAFSGSPRVALNAHVQNLGWQGYRANLAGTTGRSLRVEALRASLEQLPVPGTVSYRTHVQDKGWVGWSANGAASGTTGRSLRVEAVEMRLEGEAAQRYDLWYRVHSQHFGWSGWAKAGEKSGTEGFGYRAEAVEARLVAKGKGAPGKTSNTYRVRITKTGWQNPNGYYKVSFYSVPPRAGSYWPFNYVTPSRIAANASRQDCINAFVQRAREYLGTPYRWNYSCAPGVGVDCAGLVYQCAYATGMDMGEFNPWDHWSTGWSGWHSHDANNMWSYAKIRRLPINQRQTGDLIFYPGHVAIYIGGDQIIHAYTTTVIQSHYAMPGWILGVGRLYN